MNSSGLLSSFSLPTEIYLAILQHCDQRTLTKCARVSKSFNHLAIPYLWRNFHITNSFRFQRFNNAHGHLALAKNAHHIEDLHLLYTEIWLLFAKTPDITSDGEPSDIFSRCTNLRRLSIQYGGAWNPQYLRSLSGPQLIHEAILGALVRNNPGIEELRLFDFVRPQILWPLINRSLPRLRNFTTSSMCSYGQATTMAILQYLPETIERIETRVQHPHYDERPADMTLLWERMSGQTPKAHPQLAYLHIDGKMYSADESALLLPFLAGCTKPLKSFRMFSLEWAGNVQVRNELSRLGVTLKDFTLAGHRGGTLQNDVDIAERLCHSDRWETINMDFCKGIGPLSLSRLMDSCKNIRRLSLAGCSTLSSADFVVLLGHMPHLEAFEALGYERGDEVKTLNPVLYASDMVGSLVWGSRSLKIFRCKITVDRRDVEMQQRTYQKLAELPLLQVLTLGQTYSWSEKRQDPRFHHHCLPMTLESGLDELKALKNLKKLSVFYMAHNVGVPEMEWMDINWPALEVVEGLLSAVRDHLPGVLQWMKTRRPRWVPGYGV
ncbi:hypothetical protein BG004_005965 [Podila humilis]|nr:hypothetical protein BG004_005965 [Podila humilis]